MKLFARPKYFFEAIASLTILNCLLGLRVFEYPRDQPRPVLSLMYLLLIYVVYCGGSLRMEEKYYANINLMKLEYILYQLLSYVIITSVILKMLLGWWHTKKFKICHKKIFEVDETLRQLGLTVNYDRIYYVTIGIIILFIAFAFVMCTVVFIHLKIRTDMFNSIYIVLVYTYSLVVNSINIFEFYLFASCLHVKFRLVNQLLRESLTNWSTKGTKLGIFEIKDYIKIMDSEQRKRTLSMKVILRWRQIVSQKRVAVVSQIQSYFPFQFEERFPSELQNCSERYNPATKCKKMKFMLQVTKQVHLELSRISKMVCNILGVQTAWEIGVIIMILTGSFYNLYIRYIMNQHKVKGLAGQTSVTLVLCFLHIFKAISLNRACKNAADEGNKTIEIIHGIYGCADTDMQEEMQQFGIQILQSPVTFSAFGLILNNHVLSMILKSVTIYMVIMLQVSNALEANNAIQRIHF